MLDTPQTALNVFNAAYIEEQKLKCACKGGECKVSLV